MKSLSFERRLRLPVDPPRVIPRCSGLLLLFAFSQLAAGGEPQPGSKGAMPDRAAFLSREQSQRIIGFLTGDRLLRQGDGTFQTSAGKTPLSYASQNLAYWAESVCGAGDCRVRDVVRDPPFSLLGEDLQAFSTKMQIERVMMLQGTNIYDAAVWQIALALGAREGLLGRQEAGELIQGQLDRLRKVASRAEPQFTYGHDEARIKNAQYAYGLRFLAPAFMLPDPFRDTPYAGWIDTPPSFQDRFDKHISWMDWKPITGENAWANLLGPLQATFLLHGADVHQIPEDDPALQHALESLWPLQRMQSALGAFYYACNGALGNQGEEIEKNTVIVENNVSLLAALQVLEGTLQGVLESGQRLEPVERAKLTTGVNVIRIMLYGGGTRTCRLLISLFALVG